MSAHDSMSQHQFPFLHGSDKEFAPGDLITSSMARGVEPERASTTARSTHTRSYPGTPYSSPLRSNSFFTTAPEHASMFGDNVYEVEPTGRYSVDQHDHGRMRYYAGNDPEHYRSTAPLRVVGKASTDEYGHVRPRAVDGELA